MIDCIFSKYQCPSKIRINTRHLGSLPSTLYHGCLSICQRLNFALPNRGMSKWWYGVKHLTRSCSFTTPSPLLMEGRFMVHCEWQDPEMHSWDSYISCILIALIRLAKSEHTWFLISNMQRQQWLVNGSHFLLCLLLIMEKCASLDGCFHGEWFRSRIQDHHCRCFPESLKNHGHS